LAFDNESYRKLFCTMEEINSMWQKQFFTPMLTLLQQLCFKKNSKLLFAI